MLILHTSDWHLGRDLYGWSRHEDQSVALDSIIRIAGHEQPDVMLVCGDIFDTPQPPLGAQQLFWNTLLRLREAVPHMPVVVLAGNHDSGRRLELPHRMAAMTGIRLIGTYRSGADFSTLADTHIIELPGKGWIVALPFAYHRVMDSDKVNALIAEVDRRNTAGLPVIVTGHTTLLGADAAGHADSSTGNVGGIDSIPVTDYAEGFDYLALGHIHKPQWVPGTGHRARYCGAPMAHAFDEMADHGVSLVRLDRRGELPDVRHINIEAPSLLLSPGYDGSPLDADDAVNMVRSGTFAPGTFLRFRIAADDGLPPDFRLDLERICTEAGVRLCNVDLHFTGRPDNERRTLDINTLRATSPVDMAMMYMADTGQSLTEDELQLLRMVQDETIAMLRDDAPTIS